MSKLLVESINYTTMIFFKYFLPCPYAVDYHNADPAVVSALCRQSAKRYASVILPKRVQELVNKYPYLSALCGAHGMWAVDKYTRQQIPLHSDRLLFSGYIPTRELFSHDALEPIPVGLYHNLSGYHIEIDFLTAIGMLHEEDYKNNTNSFNSRYNQLVAEYNDAEKDTTPIGTYYTASRDDIQALKALMQLENDLFRYFSRYTPEVLKERHAIIEEIITLAPKAETAPQP